MISIDLSSHCNYLELLFFPLWRNVFSEPMILILHCVKVILMMKLLH